MPSLAWAKVPTSTRKTAIPISATVNLSEANNFKMTISQCELFGAPERTVRSPVNSSYLAGCDSVCVAITRILLKLNRACELFESLLLTANELRISNDLDEPH